MLKLISICFFPFWLLFREYAFLKYTCYLGRMKLLSFVFEFPKVKMFWKPYLWLSYTFCPFICYASTFYIGDLPILGPIGSLNSWVCSSGGCYVDFIDGVTRFTHILSSLSLNIQLLQVFSSRWNILFYHHQLIWVKVHCQVNRRFNYLRNFLFFFPFFLFLGTFLVGP